jgi:hypothetical protein
LFAPEWSGSLIPDWCVEAITKALDTVWDDERMRVRYYPEQSGFIFSGRNGVPAYSRAMLVDMLSKKGCNVVDVMITGIK